MGFYVTLLGDGIMYCAKGITKVEAAETPEEIMTICAECEHGDENCYFVSGFELENDNENHEEKQTTPIG